MERSKARLHFFRHNSPSSRALVDRSGRTERLWPMSRANLAWTNSESTSVLFKNCTGRTSQMESDLILKPLFAVSIQEDNDNELFCRTCDQYFSSLHNKREHMYGRQHLQMLTGEFEREAETMATASVTTNHVSNSEPQVPSGAQEPVPVETTTCCPDPPLDIPQFTEMFLEQNLSK